MFSAIVSEAAVVLRTLSLTQAFSEGRPPNTPIVEIHRKAYRAAKASAGRHANTHIST